MSDNNLEKFVYRVADLRQNQQTRFVIEPDAAALEALTRDLDIVNLRKLRFEGAIMASGKRDWKVQGALGATVVQACVVTLAPVTTRIDAEIEWIFKADYQSPEVEEYELTDEENVEQLGTEIDVFSVMRESLALNLPLYPRAPDATFEKMAYTEPGKKAMTDEDARPFAGLAGLKDKLAGDDQN
ncbi:DUF177 domain-containing protein [Cognatishimia sp. SS12]|uniref:YceD family protein n=1 Tax=Cognatishimia sp. SS12 TaxID=2979465 RepID=UPI00232A81EE|nr:DUF177 domain-containing protein [Cognatishimia sp. SS12]MDC0737334.1 DUF177 domain-containing protein [Cognatishimia sp. SS12]